MPLLASLRRRKRRAVRIIGLGYQTIQLPGGRVVYAKEILAVQDGKIVYRDLYGNVKVVEVKK